jgi:hypothetical protein
MGYYRYLLGNISAQASNENVAHTSLILRLTSSPLLHRCPRMPDVDQVSKNLKAKSCDEFGVSLEFHRSSYILGISPVSLVRQVSALLYPLWLALLRPLARRCVYPRPAESPRYKSHRAPAPASFGMNKVSASDRAWLCLCGFRNQAQQPPSAPP